MTEGMSGGAVSGGAMSGQRRWTRGPVLAWAALVVVYLVWGSTYLAIRVGVRDIPPTVLAGVRYLVAGALLYPIATRTGDGPRDERRPTAAQWLASAVVGLLLLVLGNGGLTVGERSLPSGLAAVLVATVPLWMVVFAVPLRRHRVTGRAVAGLLVGLVGVGVLAGGGPAGSTASGIVIVLAASAAWGLGSVLGDRSGSPRGARRAEPDWSFRLRLPRRALLAAAMEMIAGGVVLLVAALADGDFARMRWGGVHATSWFALGWLIVPGSVLAFTAYGYALGHLPLTTVSTYAYVNPVVAVILGTVLLHEDFTVREGLGSLLVVGSVVLAMNRPSRPGTGTGGSGRDAAPPAVAAQPTGHPTACDNRSSADEDAEVTRTPR